MNTKSDTDSVVIEVPISITSQQALVNSLLSISEAIQSFLDSLILTAKSHGQITEADTIIVTRKQLQETARSLGRGASDPVMSKRLTSLCELHVATLHVHKSIEGRDRYHLYKFSDLTALAALPHVRVPKEKKTKATRRTPNSVSVQKELFIRDPNAIMLQGHKELSVFFHQQIFNGILDTAMRLSQKDTRKIIDVTYNIAGAPLYIRATCSTDIDSGIAILTDQRAMRPIISYCKKDIARKRAALAAEHGDSFEASMVPNLFRLDIHELCDLMGLQPLSENINRVVTMMQRLADTTFRVDARENSWFRENFSLMMGLDDVQSDVFEFRFLHNMEIAREHQTVLDMFGTSSEELVPRIYSFSLEIRLFYSLVVGDSTIFLSHQALSNERSGIIQRFYNWARGFISGRSKPGLRNKWYSITDMHQKLTPAARFDNFRRHFLTALERFAIGEFQRGVKGEFLVYGYYVYYEKRDDGEWFRFDRDRNDTIVGDNSNHNVQLRQSYIDLIEGDDYSIIAEDNPLPLLENQGND